MFELVSGALRITKRNRAFDAFVVCSFLLFLCLEWVCRGALFLPTCMRARVFLDWHDLQFANSVCLSSGVPCQEWVVSVIAFLWEGGL